MTSRSTLRTLLATVCTALALAAVGGVPGATASDPTFVFLAGEREKPGKEFNGPCGLAVDPNGNFYVADYGNRVVSVYSAAPEYITQATGADPGTGPCGLAIDSTGKVYVNVFHQSVELLTPSVFPPTVTANYGRTTLDPGIATGVAVDPVSNRVYVNRGTHILVYESTGLPVLQGGEPLEIGASVLGDAFGLAYSTHTATLGRIYVADAADNAVKVFDPEISPDIPVEVIDETLPPTGTFNSLRDSAIAVDRGTGEIYVTDNQQPRYTERGQAVVHVYSAMGTYRGHLKYSVTDAVPPGLAVDNSTALTQGRVYVTSGNTSQAAVYAYPPGSATTDPVMSPLMTLSISAVGSGGGAVTNAITDLSCVSSCTASMRSGATFSLQASADPGSTFVGWSGAGCSGREACEVTMSEARSVVAEFAATHGSPSPGVAGEAQPASAAPVAPLASHVDKVAAQRKKAAKRAQRKKAAKRAQIKRKIRKAKKKRMQRIKRQRSKASRPR